LRTFIVLLVAGFHVPINGRFWMPTDNHLFFGIVCLVVSLMTGMVILGLGVAITTRLELVEALYGEMESEDGKAIVAAARARPKEMSALLIAPYWGPLRWMMRRAAERGKHDALSADKGNIRLLCWFVYMAALHGALIAVGIIGLVMGLK